MSYPTGDDMRADLVYFSKSLMAFELGEYNPDVSLSYIWGNNAYPNKRMGSLPLSYVPEPIKFEAGELDDSSIMYELSQDLADLLDEGPDMI